ncbi:MAG: hypothetical protein E5V85_19045, partial [Mesorhizobium sp.]
MQQLHGSHARRVFFRHNRFFLKLLRKLDRTPPCWHMAGFSSPLLATLPGCSKMRPGFLFSGPAFGAECPQLLTLPAFIFNDSDLWSAATINTVATGEAEIGTGSKLDFASLLDELIIASE